nr:MAG TPA: hypothetical protein [Caudoviricetes sp.]
MLPRPVRKRPGKLHTSTTKSTRKPLPCGQRCWISRVSTLPILTA